MNDIICPNCGKIVRIDEAVRRSLEKTILKEESAKQKIELEKAKLEAEKEAEKKFKEENKNLEEKLLKERKEREEFEKKVSEQATKNAEKEFSLKLKEKDKQLEDAREAAKKANDELKRKLNQGSQQLQGEVLELDLEEKLKSTFVNDDFVPVPKGVEGADIWQKVKFQGKVVGSILWETKRTKAWSNLWLGKLKNDSAKINASESVIVSQSLPSNAESFDRKDGVWITTYEHAISIARYVRFLITTVSKVKSSASQTDEDWTKVRDYMLSDAFTHRMRAHFDAVKNLRDVLETEKRTSTLRWKRQHAQIDKLDSNTVNFYAELKEIMSNLPELEELEVPLLEEGEVNEEESLV